MKIIAAVPKQLIEDIVALLTRASEFYYSSDTGDYYRAKRNEVPEAVVPLFAKFTKNGVINDRLYDALEDRLRQLAPKHPYLQQTGAPLNDKMKKLKIRLPFPMPSLDKVKTTESVQAWLDKHPGPYMVGNKIDGVSIGMQFGPGLRRGFTKGKNGVGGDISFMLDALGIPKVTKTMDIRAEIVIPLAKFKELYEHHETDNPKGFKNPRGMASGITNRDSLHPGLAHARVYVYEQISPRGVPSTQIAALKTMGFHVVPFKVYDTLSPNKLKAILAERRAKAAHEMDGLVIVQNRKNPTATADNPDWAIAYKDDTADDQAVVTVTNVEWNVTRTGRVFPRIMIEPVQLKGVTVTYCTGKSGMTIKKGGIGPGARIRIARSGDVIPDYRETVKAVKPQLPSKKLVGDWHWNGENIDLVDSEGGHEDSSNTMLVKQLEFFFTTIGVENFKYATIAKYVDAGYTDVASILALNEKKFMLAVDTSEKVLRPVYADIHARLTNIELPRLMYASAVFGRSFGLRRFTSILKVLPNVMSMSSMPVAELTRIVDDIPGFDEVTARQFAENLRPFVRWLKRHPTITTTKLKTVKAVSTKLKGVAVLFTLFRDKELEELIVKNGGTLASGIASATVVITTDPNGTSIKLDAARERRIPIMRGAQFRKKYGFPS